MGVARSRDRVPVCRAGRGCPQVKEAVHLGGSAAAGPELAELLAQVAQGDQRAFAAVYDRISGPVLGLVRSALRDPAQSEEVAQELPVEVWHGAARFRPEKGAAMTWIMTLAHRRAVDRGRYAQAASDREERAAQLAQTPALRNGLIRLRDCLGVSA